MKKSLFDGFDDIGYLLINFFELDLHSSKRDEDSEIQGKECWEQRLKEKVWVIQYPLMEGLYNSLFDKEIVRDQKLEYIPKA